MPRVFELRDVQGAGRVKNVMPHGVRFSWLTPQAVSAAETWQLPFPRRCETIPAHHSAQPANSASNTYRSPEELTAMPMLCIGETTKRGAISDRLSQCRKMDRSPRRRPTPFQRRLNRPAGSEIFECGAVPQKYMSLAAQCQPLRACSVVTRRPAAIPPPGTAVNEPRQLSNPATVVLYASENATNTIVVCRAKHIAQSRLPRLPADSNFHSSPGAAIAFKTAGPVPANV